MKKVLLMIASSTLITACNNSGTSSANKQDSSAMSNNASSVQSKRERNEKTALASIEAFNAHDVAGTYKDASPDAMDYFDGSMKPAKGIDSMKAALQPFLTAFPDIKGSNLMAMSDADGKHVIVVADWTGTFKGEMMGMKPNGKSVKYMDGDLFTFNDDGKITEHRSIQSIGTVMAQLTTK
jgi:predicted ester cyclase